MKVVYVSVVGGLGGAERCLLTAMGAMKRTGHEVELISCTDGPLLGKARELGVGARVVAMPAAMAATGEAGVMGTLLRGLVVGPSTWLYARKLRRAVDLLGADVVHSNGLKVHLLLAIARPAAPVVWHLHDFIGSRRTMSRVLKWASKKATRAIAISNAVKVDAGAILACPIDTVMNAIDTGHFAPAGEGRVGDGGPLKVGLIATYARWKGQDLFLQAAQLVLKARPGVVFHIVGGAIYHTSNSQWTLGELEAMARGLGVEGAVRFEPFAVDTAPVYRGLDVVVHASTQPEPFGLTIVEAMACGRAVIISRAGGAAEIVTDGEDGLGFKPGDAEDLAEKILRLLGDAELRRRLGVKARATAEGRFSDGRLARELEGVYVAARRG